MGNVIKYTTTPVNNSIKKGNFALGINDIDYGPTNITGFYSTTIPSTSGYTVYNENGGTLSYESVSGTTPLINYLSNKRGVSMTTAGESLSWAAGQSNIFVTNREYENIVTSGMVLNLDAGFVSSYPTSATTWYDLSYSGNNGTLTNGPTFSSLSGGSIVFDGVDDYVSESNFSGVITNSFAISTWLNFTNANTPTYQKIFHAQSGITEVNLDNYFGDGGNAKIHFYTAANSGSSNNIMTSKEDIINNVWYYVTAIYDNNLYIKYLYINGILKNFGTTTVKINWPNSVTRIGLRLTNIEPFNGRMSSIQLYNRALSPFEVYQNYNSTKGRFGVPDIVTSGLTLNLDAGNPYSYNPLNTGSTTWVDTTYLTTGGTLTNGTNYSGGTMVFDGTDDYVQVGTSAVVNESLPFTVSFWMKLTEMVNGKTAPFLFKTNSGANFILIFGENSSQYKGTVLIVPGASAAVKTDTNTSFFLNNWVNITVTYNGLGATTPSNYVIYENTVLKNQNTGVGGVADPRVNTIFGYLNSNNVMKGNVSLMQIYNRALSASEVQQNFNALRGRYGI
jgi:hypothetical protein